MYNLSEPLDRVQIPRPRDFREKIILEGLHVINLISTS